VIGILYSDQVKEEASRLSGASPGSSKWLGQYKNALETIKSEMSEEGMRAAQERKDDMNAGDIPRDVQGRYIFKSNFACII